MRNLKKILALVLALMMVLSVMVFASAANYDDYSDKDQVSPEYAEAVEVLTGMDIFWGSENSFYPKSNVTRAEVATLLYRIMTGDITGSQVGIYKDYGMFDDVLETNWFAGYVNYAANGELVVGVGDNKYNPKGNVTGYEWITMLLRAIGYDANGEISGSTWKITAASQAKQAGILGSFNEATLNSALTREQVAYLLFNAIQARKVNYTNAFGYRPSSLGYTIAWDMFRLAKTDTISVDAWGRPGYVWYGESSSTATPNTANYSSTADTLYATMEEAPVKTYTTAVTECDVATDVGIRTTKTYTTYTNGVENDGSKTIRATATTATIGEQGRLTEVYADRIVYIDTLFAFVTDVNETTYDNAGHVRRYATMDLDVYVNGNNPQMVVETNYAGDWEYTVGTALLINAVTVDEDDHAAILEGDDQHVEIVDVADSFVGAQSRVWWNAEQHTIDGDTYDDAFCFHLDVAGSNTTIRFNWWLDQYGNLIAVTDLDRNSYAVLKDLIWIDGRPGYAEATLINMDGTEYTAEVATIDGEAGNAFDWANFDWDGTYEPALSDRVLVEFFNGSANVSSNSNYNDLYEGYALYRVTTNDDDSVNLRGYFDADRDDDKDNGEVNLVTYVSNATLDTTASAILDTNGRQVIIHVDDATQFIVNNGNGTYSAYTGTDELPAYVDGTVDLFYDGTASVNRVADVVYIKNASLETDFGDHLFVTSNNFWRETASGVYQMTVVVDGVERVVTTDQWSIVDLLADNVGKLFHVTWDSVNYTTTYGMVTNVDLVNEATDAERACNYLSQNITVTAGGLLCNGESYSIDDGDTAVSNIPGIDSWEDITKRVVDNYGIWVVSETSPYNIATTVYVGEKLDDDVSATVRIVDGDDRYTSVYDADTKTYTVTLPEDVTLSGSAYYEIVATGDANARLNVGNVNSCVVSNQTYFLDHSRVLQIAVSNTQFTVTAENGLDTETYFLDCNEVDNQRDVIAFILDEGNRQTTLYNGRGIGYKNIQAALSDVQALDFKDATSGALGLEAGVNPSSVKYGCFTRSAEVKVDGIITEIVRTGSISAANTGEYIAVSVTDGNGDTWYTVFQVIG